MSTESCLTFNGILKNMIHPKCSNDVAGLTAVKADTMSTIQLGPVAPRALTAQCSGHVHMILKGSMCSISALLKIPG